MGSATTVETQVRGGIRDESRISLIVAGVSDLRRKSGHGQLGPVGRHHTYCVPVRKDTGRVYLANSGSSLQG